MYTHLQEQSRHRFDIKVIWIVKLIDIVKIMLTYLDLKTPQCVQADNSSSCWGILKTKKRKVQRATTTQTRVDLVV